MSGRRTAQRPKSTYYLITFVDRDSKEQRDRTCNTQTEAIALGRALLRDGHTDVRFRGDQQTDWIRLRNLVSRTKKKKRNSLKQYPFSGRGKKRAHTQARDPFRRDPQTGLLPGSPKGLTFSSLPEGRKKTKKQRGGDAMEKRLPGSFESNSG